MKLHSKYLNPFKPFREREPHKPREESVGAAFENNMSRSVFSALGNAKDPCALAMFVQALAESGSEGKTEARELALRLAETMRVTDASQVEWDLQTWPAAATQEREDTPIQERAKLPVLLIGISCSHKRDWTAGTRHPSNDCHPDAWVYLPGKMLLVFEAKNDEHALDVSQLMNYARKLGLLPKTSLPSVEADLEALRKVVLDVPWSTVVDALKRINRSDGADPRGCWLCGKAAAYLERHVYPAYEGVATIAEWLKGRDTPRRSKHLRRLVQKLGDALAQAAPSPDVITFAKNENGDSELLRGGGSAVYVKLQRDGQPLGLRWLGRKVTAVLWFDFADEKKAERIGLSF